MPNSVSRSITRSIIGRPQISIIGFGKLSLIGRIRSPRPAASTMA